MTKHDYVLVANGSEAKIYQYREQGKSLILIDSLANVSRRDQDQDLVTDRPGVMSAGGSSIHGKSALAPEESPTDKAKEDFAQSIAEYLDETRTKDVLNSVDIISSPEMLGLLREKMNNNLIKLVDYTITKDVVDKSEDDLLDVLSAEK